MAAAEPVVATQLGMADHAGELPDLSAPALATYVADARRLLERFDRAAASAAGDEAIDAVTGGQIARRVVRAFETRRVQHANPGLYLDASYGVLLLMIKEIGTPADRVEAMAGRLRGAARRARGGPRQPARAAAAAVRGRGPRRRARGSRAGRRGGAARRRRARPARRARRAGSRAAAAVARFGDELRRRYLPDAAPDVAGGRELLVDILAHEYLLGETPEQIAAVGRAAVAEAHAAMTELAATMGHASAAAAVAAVQADRPSRQDLLESYREALGAARRFVVEHDLVTLAPGEELVVEPTPAALRGSLPFAAYEGAGPYDRLQRGYYWVTVPSDELLRLRPGAGAGRPPLCLDADDRRARGLPGHHTQWTRANRAPTLARRVAFLPDGGTLLIEGWAFYCEEMMEAQGFLVAPAVRLMRLNDQLWRACRVVIDMELHLGCMSFEEAVDFLSREAHMDRREAELECAGTPRSRATR